MERKLTLTEQVNNLELANKALRNYANELEKKLAKYEHVLARCPRFRAEQEPVHKHGGCCIPQHTTQNSKSRHFLNPPFCNRRSSSALKRIMKKIQKMLIWQPWMPCRNSSKIMAWKPWKSFWSSHTPVCTQSTSRLMWLIRKKNNPCINLEGACVPPSYFHVVFFMQQIKIMPEEGFQDFGFQLFYCGCLICLCHILG